jgi:hypothetical protein
MLWAFFENRCPLTQIVQTNPIAAQEPSWLTHLHPRPKGNVDPESSSRRMPWLYIEIRHGHFLPHSYQSLITKVVDAVEADLLTASLCNK